MKEEASEWRVMEREGQREVWEEGECRDLREMARDRSGGGGREEVRREAAGCAIGHNHSPSLLTSMCHLTVLQMRLHMLCGDVRTHIWMLGLNLQPSTLVLGSFI